MNENKSTGTSAPNGHTSCSYRHVIIYLSPFLKPNFDILIATAELLQHTTEVQGSKAAGAL
jgi:hypothetical protein